MTDLDTIRRLAKPQDPFPNPRPFFERIPGDETTVSGSICVYWTDGPPHEPMKIMGIEITEIVFVSEGDHRA